MSSPDKHSPPSGVKAARRLRLTNPERSRGQRRKYQRRKSGWAPGQHEIAEAVRAHVTACACCASSEARSKHGWVADHDHETGRFRAYLCHPCNITVGLVEKHGLDMSPSVAAYLARHTDARRLRKALRRGLQGREVRHA
jgi:hypothetical protein